MFRVFLLYCALFLFLTVATPLASAQAGGAHPASAEWTKGYTLILVDASTKAELAEARDFITASGGKVAVVLPPRAIFGWVTPTVEAQIVGKHHIRSVHRTVINAQAVGARDADTRLAVNLFNDIASGRTTRRIQKEAALAAKSKANPPGLIDAQQTPHVDRAQVMQNLRQLGGDPSSSMRTQSGQSDTMDGTVAVAVFFVESNGAGDPNLYSWSNDDIIDAVGQILDGLNWWVEQSQAFQLARPLQFTLIRYTPDNSFCQVPYEPILHPATDAQLWINQIMANLGATTGDSFARVSGFNLALRDQNHTDWAYSVFLAYNPLPASSAFTDNRASWAYIGGPYVQSLYHSYSWPLSKIISHETGHIFYACDEYFSPGYQTCSCSCAPVIRPDATNGNCQDASCTPNSTACIMRLNELALCPHTVAQIGWISSVPAPPPTAPISLVATASSPTQVTLVWQDTSAGTPGAAQGFQIERRGGTSADFSLLATISADGTSSPKYEDTSALPNTAYAYRLRAFNKTGSSDYTNEASVVTPTATTNFSIDTTDLPNALVGVLYDRKLSAGGSKGDVTWLIDSGSLPAGLALSQDGDISGTPTTAGTSNFVVKATDTSNASATKALTIIVKPSAPLTITTTQLPRGSVGTTYSQNLGATGGQTPYTWSKESGNLPDGLTFDQGTGTISGVPERAGSFSFGIKLTDATFATATITLSITVNPPISALTIDTASLPDGIVGQNYSRTLQASGGSPPYRWVIISGQLPAGLQLSDDGIISGQPTASGTANFVVQVIEQSGQTANQALSIDVDPPPQFTVLSQSPLPVAAVGVPYNYKLQATAGSAPYTWTKKKKPKFGNLPDGITLSSDGTLSGTPTAQGSNDFTVIVNDQSGRQAKKPFTIEVGPPPPPLSILTDTLPTATQGLLYTAHLDASGGVTPYTWSLDSGALPDGLTLQSDGQITGRTTTVGAASFTVRVKDATGTSTTKPFFIVVGQPPPPLVIQTVQLPDTTAERSYSQTLRASGGVAPYTWSIASGSLGQGLNLSIDGVISGTPTTPGTSVFSVRVTDSAQQTVMRTLAIVIKPADHLAPFGNLEAPDFRVTLTSTSTGSGWALDNVGIATIEVLVDNVKITEGIYGLSRPDIGAVWGSFPNAAHSGFSFTLDTTKIPNGDHILAVRLLDAAGNATVIGTRPITTQNKVLQVTTTTLPLGKKGQVFSAQLTAANGQLPYTWTVAAGSLPAGLSLNASGGISGTPTVFGNFTFTARVTDAVNASAVSSLTLTILPDFVPLTVVSQGDQPAGLTGVDYSAQLFFGGGHPPVTWSLNTGTLPPGLTLSSTGAISGRPTTVVNSTFTVRVTDSQMATAVSSPLAIAITMGPLGVIDTGALPAASTGVNYSYQLRGTGNTPPYTWALSSGTLPIGLSLNPTTGVISGRPTIPGQYNFVIQITNSETATALSDPLSITVSAGPLSVLTTGELAAGHVNQDYAFTLLANGGKPPFTWSLTSGTLPPGLTLDGATGIISGKPTTAGPYTFVVQVKDAANLTANSTQLRITITQ